MFCAGNLSLEQSISEAVEDTRVSSRATTRNYGDDFRLVDREMEKKSSFE